MTERERAVDVAIAQIERQFGKGSIMKMSGRSRPDADRGDPHGEHRARSGARNRRRAPRPDHRDLRPGVVGQDDAGAAHHRRAQKLGGIGGDHRRRARSRSRLRRRLGVNLEELLISQPDTGEQALEIAETLVRSGALDVVVIDSVAALVPKAEIEGDMGDSHVGLQARLMSQALRKLTGAISRSKTCVVFINQLRMKIGVMFGKPGDTTGGNALKFYASVRLDIRRIETIKNGTDSIGSRVPGQGGQEQGRAVWGSSARAGHGSILDEDRLGQGRETKEFLKHNPDVLEEVRSRIEAGSPELSGRLAVRRREGAEIPRDAGGGGVGVADDDLA